MQKWTMDWNPSLCKLYTSYRQGVAQVVYKMRKTEMGGCALAEEGQRLQLA